MWLKFLSQWNCISFFLDDNHSIAADMHLYTDATDKAFGGYYDNKWFQGSFPDNLISDGDKLSMAFRELYPIVMAIVLWGHTWTSRRILFYCNKMSAVEIISKG